MLDRMGYEDARFMMRCLRYRLRTERLQLKTLTGLNLRAATALDIGANKGIYSFWLSRAVGPEGEVIAFEPQPEMASYINARKARFRWGNVTTFNVALSSKRGSASLSRKRIGDGSASLCREIGDSISVPLARLDEFPISNLKFIKCDVEGHEHQVFLGAEQTIRRHRPVVQFEATHAPDLFSFFLSQGYSGVMMLGDRYLPYSNPENVPHYKFGLSGHRDFLFFPPEAIGSIIPRDMSSKFP